VQVDPEKLEGVLLNLLSNAFKFTPPGGRVQCTVNAANDRFVLAVQDSGPGVPREMRDSIFERFRQAQGGATREFGGTGLGLSIAKDFVELHGGTIAISEAPAGGTLVQVEIPIHAPKGAQLRVANESESIAPVPSLSTTQLRNCERATLRPEYGAKSDGLR
jgi:signal transduction histidine kinase